MIYFTSDLHFGHSNIIEYENRPFKNADIMDRDLIKEYNSVVTNDDSVYILGDFSLKRSNYKEYLRNIVESMRGNKIIILGNHDGLKPFDYVDIGFKYVSTYLELPVTINNMIVGWLGLTHDPTVAIVDKSKVWLCGHVHSQWSKIENHDQYGNHIRILNVGVDVRKFKPISINEIMKEFNIDITY